MKFHRVLLLLLKVAIIQMCCPLYSRGASSCDQNINCESSKDECYRSMLEQLPERIGNNTKTEFCSSNISLTTNVIFSQLHNISITSSWPNTTITCISENAGLLFTKCSNVTISDITIRGCGFSRSSQVNIVYKSSLYVLNCTNVTLSNVTIANSNGNGLIMMDTYGRVDILSCTYEHNSLIKTNTTEATIMGGGGVFLDVTSHTETLYGKSFNTQENSCGRNKLCNTYKFENCRFINNSASSVNHRRNLTYLGHRLERGGGLNIAIRNTAKYNSIKIANGAFYNNSASWGGGLYVVYHKSPENNSVEIIDSEFIQNYCSTNRGGGGASIGYAFFHNTPPHDNKIAFTDCWFRSNRANFSGGVAIYSSRSTHSIIDNTFQFTNCTWMSNKAQYGSAVTVLPQIWDAVKSGFLPTTIFTTCTFISNTMDETPQRNDMYTFFQNGKGAFLISRFTVEFQGVTNFTGSTGTALYVTSGIVKFTRESEATFFNNSGLDGGAISLHGFSAIYVSDNSTITFKGNSATNRGGAIFFYSFNKQDYTYSRSCFIQYDGEEEDKDRRNLTVLFKDNVARIQTNESSKSELNFGNSIFATNLIPCKTRCSVFSDLQEHCDSQLTSDSDNKYMVHKHPFSCIGTFTFENGIHEIATSGQGFCTQTNDPHPLKLIPGKEVEVPVTLYDDLNQKAWAIYHVSIENQNTVDTENNQITIDKQYTYTHITKLKLYGNPGGRARVKIATIGAREIAVSFDVELQQCPPGFVINGTESARKCICSAHTAKERSIFYKGVQSCDDISFRAYITRGYWIGYQRDKNETENSLFSAYCPKDFCFHNNLYEVNNKYILTYTASKRDLDKLVCGPNRTGTLCGKCIVNYSVYYHTHSHHCYKNYLCHWGPVFYIISELLPVSILFIIVTVFNIPFTSGAVNGALFFIQVINTMQTNNFIYVPHSTFRLVYTKMYHIIYRSFNLNFFTIDDWSFCLLEGATALDMIAFKYVTIVYSLVLVVLTVVVIRLCNYQQLQCNRRRRRRPNVQSSIIHGLSAFFVMTFSLCTHVSLILLTPGHIRPQSTHNESSSQRVVFYDGELEFLKREHLKYAIPAMFFTVVFILIPPILLIIYPLCYRIFGLLKIGETRCVQVTCKIIPLERLKPLFDSFQGSFKDDYRFFAGLYFLYRLVALAGFAFATSFTKFYSILEILLILMLTFHSIAQPYKERWHNIMDTLLFCNLAIINRLTMHNYKRFSVRYNYQQEIKIITMTQDILTSLPFLYITIYAVIQIVLKVKRHCRKKATGIEEEQENWTMMSDKTGRST